MVDFKKRLLENRQSAERVFSNTPAPQSDDDSLYQSQGYHTLGEDEMIKLQRSNTPTGSTTPKGVQFLSPKHVTSPDGFDAEITKVSTPDNGGKSDNFGNPYVVYFSHGFDKYSKGFKPTSDLLASLVEILGADDAKWIGKKVLISKKLDDDGGERLTFSPVAKPATKTR